ncbi:recombinase RecT [Brucella haematophila]|uniref:recombinase RecT n=1 Tax=Brucella haematophila TaxID=419474 RepID=UPI00110D7537|nr:recombinase RecT [Brucella haematophila]TMU84698.1 recombinase RecT [Brucella haematophila]
MAITHLKIAGGLPQKHKQTIADHTETRVNVTVTVDLRQEREMNQLATRETSINTVSVSAGATGSNIAPQNLGEVVRFAEVMSKADIALPKHLRNNAGACMAVAMQALEWQMSPFAVASKSYSVNGTIAYEAQLIAAVVNTRSGIKGRLKYEYKGTGNDMTCTVSGILDGETYEYTSPSVGSITTKNSPLWKSDPQQQLGYFAARSWARRYVPEVLLGVYDREEAQDFQGADNAKNITPVQTVADPFGDEPQSAKVEEAEIVTEEPETPASEPDTGEQGASEPSFTDADADAWVLKSVNMLIASAMIGGDMEIMRNQYRVVKQNAPERVDLPTMGRVNTVSMFLAKVMDGEEEFDKARIANLSKLSAEQINDLPEVN